MPASRIDGVVAQLVERLVRNEKVAGSIPVGSTIQERLLRVCGDVVRNGELGRKRPKEAETLGIPNETAIGGVRFHGACPVCQFRKDAPVSS